MEDLYRFIKCLSVSHETRLVSIRHITQHSDYLAFIESFYFLINSGELLMTLRDDWLRLRTDNLKFSGLANILQGILPLVDRGRVLAVICLSWIVSLSSGPRGLVSMKLRLLAPVLKPTVWLSLDLGRTRVSLDCKYISWQGE